MLSGSPKSFTATPGNFTFRTCEFEQMELEFFCEPDTDLEWFQYWRGFCHDWLLSLGMNDECLRLRDHSPEELSFYSKATTDFEYLFPFGWGELWGVADRTNYDLTQHQNESRQDMSYYDQEKNTRYIPYVIEPSLGADRVALAFLVDAYDEEVVDPEKNDVRTVLRLHPFLAPMKCAVLSLLLPYALSLLVFYFSYGVVRLWELPSIALTHCVFYNTMTHWVDSSSPAEPDPGR